MTSQLSLLFLENFEKVSKEEQDRVYTEFYLLVYPQVLHMIKDHSATQDVIQEAFLRAVQKAPTVLDADKVDYWVRKLTRNVTLNYLKKHRKIRGELDPFALTNSQIASGSAYVSLEQEVETKLMTEMIEDYIAQLKPEYRTILSMRWMNGLSYKEIAEQLGVTEGIVRQRLYRAREAVRIKLQGDWGNS